MKRVSEAKYELCEMNQDQAALIGRREFVGMAAAVGAGLFLGGLMSGCASELGQGVSGDGERSEQSAGEGSAASGAAPEEEVRMAAGKSLVAVFSWSGNTLQIAGRINELVDSDLFRIEPSELYTENYDDLLEIGRAEQNEGILPELAATVENWDEYETVYLGFPTWWSHLPQAVASFLHLHDLAGKTVLPFNTSGSSGFASTLSDIQSICPDVRLSDGISITADAVADSLDQVDAWLGESGLW